MLGSISYYLYSFPLSPIENLKSSIENSYNVSSRSFTFSGPLTVV